MPSLSPHLEKMCFSYVLDVPGCRTQSAVLYKDLLGRCGVNSVLLSSALKQARPEPCQVGEFSAFGLLAAALHA